MSNAKFRVNRGSDLTFVVEWPNGEGGAADLTGWTVGIFEPVACLEGLVTATMDDPSTGVIRTRIEWRDGQPSGEYLSFRLSIQKDAEDQTTNLLGVIYK
jgi:hypothetical protein